MTDPRVKEERSERMPAELVQKAETRDDDDPPISSTMGADLPPPSARSIGSVVAGGKYRVERILGRGGMGIVLSARHVTLGEPVAIKFMSAESAKDATAAERFLREARTALKIKGEHVVRVLDVGTEDGRPYLVMEHLDGTDLSTLVADHGPLAVSDAALYVLQACEALAEAHAIGIVHRDLKPSNLFLARRPDGTPLVKVLDFGIAKAASAANGESASNPSLTDTRAVFGSPAYMSPEQIRSAKNVDARTDIWALGVVMYELLSGQHPFRGESTAAVLASVIADTPESLRSLRADIPRELAQAIEDCLQKDINKRTASVLDLALVLAPFAPAGQISTERIRRLSTAPRGMPARPSVPDAAPSQPKVAPAASGTNAPWATTAPRKENRSARLAVIVGGAVLVSAMSTLAAVRYMNKPAATVAPATQPAAPSSPAQPAATSTQNVPPPEPAPIKADDPPKSPPIVADKAAPAAGKTTRRRPAEQAPTAQQVVTPPPPSASIAPPVAAPPPPAPEPAPAVTPRPIDPMEKRR